MSKKKSEELMKLDIYELLGLSIEASETEIKKVYRKKALKCHPDKNPDNPSAAEEFDRLKKILEILLDPGARSAYDKLLKARKAAAIRARETDAKTQKLRSKLEEREKLAKAQPQISEEERLRRELKRLEEEGERLIEEELKRVNNEVKDELRRGKTQPKEESAKPADPGSHKVRVKWIATDDWPGYTEEEINQLFFKWGKINALVVSQKGKKGTALLDYDTKLGADMAVQFEKGKIEHPVEVSHYEKKEVQEKSKKEKKAPSKPCYDFESVAEMNRRREKERKRLIDEMIKGD
ncbi:dnaJ homolog subfamily C member 17-like isoform X2 [Oratosquilla oratoria]|uniref:dnaJ homolog subfamily C member 17-like isoform X2 n=1 Tax=Oratosquilla oratoria TaxID=337810 RepID=UPI003F771C56